jgi:hypothetical protein
MGGWIGFERGLVSWNKVRCMDNDTYQKIQR